MVTGRLRREFCTARIVVGGTPRQPLRVAPPGVHAMEPPPLSGVSLSLDYSSGDLTVDFELINRESVLVGLT